MDLDGGNPFLGAFEGVGPEISTFWAQMALATLVPITGPKKSQFQGPPLQTPLVMDYSPIQIHTSHPPHINNMQVLLRDRERRMGDREQIT